MDRYVCGLESQTPPPFLEIPNRVVGCGAQSFSPSPPLCSAGRGVGGGCAHNDQIGTSSSPGRTWKQVAMASSGTDIPLSPTKLHPPFSTTPSTPPGLTWTTKQII